MNHMTILWARQKKENKKKERVAHNTAQKQLMLPAMELVLPMICPCALQFNTLPRCILCTWYFQKRVYIETSNQFITLLKSLQWNKTPLLSLHHLLLPSLAAIVDCRH